MGSILILGSSRSLWDDVAWIRNTLSPTYDTMAINFAGLFYDKPLDHWASLHGELLEELYDLRSSRKKPFKECTTLHYADMYPEHFRLGCSGLFATKIALELGYNTIYLAGCELDGKGHFYDPPWISGYCENLGGTIGYWASLEHLFKNKTIVPLSGRLLELC